MLEERNQQKQAASQKTVLCKMGKLNIFCLNAAVEEEFYFLFASRLCNVILCSHTWRHFLARARDPAVLEAYALPFF
jgi:hypothetical protein